jgi:lactate dehydrogenase-like 2-hydroxyacid dehydrogenase
MKILVFGPQDRYDVYRPDFVSQLPVKLVFRTPEQTYVQAAQENSDAQILFVDAITPVQADVMDALPQLKMIHSEGVGYNCIDCDAARERGIFVCNNKGCNAASVAEHTIMLMLMALRYGIQGHTAVAEGRQIQMKQQAIAARKPGLFQCSVGLVGFGDTAQATARRLAAFGCPLYYYTAHRRSPEVESDFGVTYLPLEELAATCDIISLHCAVTEETQGMINAAFISRMKPEAVLVNCARGALVDNEALRQALIDGRIACAALDTIEPEPTPGDHPLVDLPEEAKHRAIYSAHLGGSSGGSFAKAHLTMWENARLILAGERPTNIVNL